MGAWEDSSWWRQSESSWQGTERWNTEEHWQDASKADWRRPSTTDANNASQWSNQAKWRSFELVGSSVKLSCQIREPWCSAKPGEKLPLLLFLHSASYKPLDDLFPQGDAWLDSLDPMIVLCPTCPDDFYWLRKGNSWTEQGGQWLEDSEGCCYWDAPPAEDMALALDELLGRLPDFVAAVDLTRVLLTGVSMGGNGTLELAALLPNRFAAVAPVASHLEDGRLDFVVSALTSIPMWAVHGIGDCCCPYVRTSQLVARLPHARLVSYAESHHGLSVHNSASIVAYVDHGQEMVQWFFKLCALRVMEQPGGT